MTTQTMHKVEKKSQILIINKIKISSEFENYQLTLSLLMTSRPYGEHLQQRSVKKVSPQKPNNQRSNLTIPGAFELKMGGLENAMKQPVQMGNGPEWLWIVRSLNSNTNFCYLKALSTFRHNIIRNVFASFSTESISSKYLPRVEQEAAQMTGEGKQDVQIFRIFRKPERKHAQ